MARKKPKLVKVPLRMDKELIAKLAAVAKLASVTTPIVARVIIAMSALHIKTYWDREGKKNPPREG